MTLEQAVEEHAATNERPALDAPEPAAVEPRAAGVDTVDRVANVVVMVVPIVLVGLAAWLAWGGVLRWPDLVVFAITYLLTGAGITVGFHRLLTHRSFKTSPALRGLLAALGSAAVEGPVIEWVANHRKHHQFSDAPGDPHSPHVDHGHGWRGALGGLFHAHVGWILGGDALADRERYAKDLLADPVVRLVDRTFLLWVALGLAFPFGLGFALTGTLVGGLTGLLWGGAVRMCCLHHSTFSINSLCHFFGRRSFDTGDESRNLVWLALPTLGEAWHNNHHAFPTSARHGLRWWQLDPSAWLIAGLERMGLVWDVIQITPERQLAKIAGGG
ncbi:MAG TPA: acyl-CoA desaturase [Solirubrobacteraceae bacterium]|jgi:stearoyl-CoA desaturase (delta-9 desaturase)|nr:acyl-CoA desaturase [Solirubrobacteraceae bacterium]